MYSRVFSLIILIVLMGSPSTFGQSSWERKIHKELPLLGHRNWIVIADSAYPLQTSPGVETLHTETDSLQVTKAILDELAQAKHVKPIIYTDSELKYVSEKNAPGISAYRETLHKLLQDRPVQVLPHEQIIARLDEAGKTFKVLLIKTPLAMPYTSIFLQLDCGYWNADAEKELREAMKKAGGN